MAARLQGEGVAGLRSARSARAPEHGSGQHGDALVLDRRQPAAFLVPPPGRAYGTVPPDAPPQHELLQHRVIRRLESLITLFAMGATVTFCKWNTARGLPEEHRNRQITIFLLECAFGATLGLLPHPQWLRHRAWIIGVLRVAVAAVPSGRSPVEGTAALLHRAASPGWGGALADWGRLLFAVRLAIHAGCCALLPQPLLAALVQQVALMALGANNLAFCRAPLLAHSLSRDRMARAAAWLDGVPWLSAQLMLEVKPAEAAGDAELQACHAVLTFMQVMLGVLAPLCLLANSWPPSMIPRPPPRTPRPAEQRQPCSRPVRLGRAVAAAAGRAWANADDCLRELLCGGLLDPLQIALAAWLLAGNCWLLCRVAAERAVAAAAADAGA